MRLGTELKRFRQEWQTSQHDWNYARASRVFGKLFSHLASQKKIPGADQFDGLYRALRWEGKCGADAKLIVYKKGYPEGVLRIINRDRIANSGIVGGALGSIKGQLNSERKRKHLWSMLSAVANARSASTADIAVKEYAKHRVPGLGIGVISTFLWALKPEYYPIVNDGSIGGLVAVIDGFVKVKSVDTYINRHVPRIRTVSQELGFRSFSQFDAFFHKLTKRETQIAQQDRVPFLTAIEREADDAGKGYIEGRKHEVTTRVAERNPKNRRAALERGYECQICGFSFEETYGVRFAEVHHIMQLARGGKRIVDPDTDLLVVCSNCHTMLHPSPKKTIEWRKLRTAVIKHRGV